MQLVFQQAGFEQQVALEQLVAKAEASIALRSRRPANTVLHHSTHTTHACAGVTWLSCPAHVSTQRQCNAVHWQLKRQLVKRWSNFGQMQGSDCKVQIQRTARPPEPINVRGTSRLPHQSPALAIADVLHLSFAFSPRHQLIALPGQQPLPATHGPSQAPSPLSTRDPHYTRTAARSAELACQQQQQLASEYCCWQLCCCCCRLCCQKCQPAIPAAAALNLTSVSSQMCVCCLPLHAQVSRDG